MKTKSTRLEKGQSMVEFAFGLVLLLILIAGIVDVGRALFMYMTLRDAAQEGAIYASTDPDNAVGIQNRVRYSSNLVQDAWADIGVNVSYTGTHCTGNAITVTVSYPNFPIITPFLGTFLGSQTVSIQASVTDTILKPACT